MIKDIIEFKRKQLYETIGLAGLTSEETLKVSQELERFMIYHTRVSGTPASMNSNQIKVHANSLQNIIDIASKEKLDLPFEINDQILRGTEWINFHFAHTLLHAMNDRYGTEIVEYIGEYVPLNCIFPKEVQSFHQALKLLNFIFNLNHKSPDYIGEYLPFMDIKNETVLFCYTPDYSSAFNYGIIQGLAKKFNHSLKVKVLDQDNGGQFKIVG